MPGPYGPLPLAIDRQTRRDDSPPHTIPYGALVLPDRVTSLPANPKSGDVVRYVADATNDIIWWLYYDASATGSYKWKPFGTVPPLYAEQQAREAVTGTGAFVAPPTAGPDITVPLAGDYMVSIGSALENATGSLTDIMHSYDVGGTAANASWCARAVLNVALSRASVTRTYRHTGVAAGAALVSKYNSTAGQNANIEYRWMSVLPIRLG